MEDIIFTQESMDRYVVFDVDHTLIDTYSLFYFLGGLRPNDTLLLSNSPLLETEPTSWLYLTTRLSVAYAYFVEEIAKREMSEDPLGIFRPGILLAMKRLNELKERGLIKGIHLYSNNSFPPVLEWIRDVVHYIIGSTDLILECIDWTHPMRVKERMDRLPEEYTGKSWETMRDILNVLPHQIYYFDDLPHRELMEVLGDRYCHISKYVFRASFDRIADIYEKVLEKAGVPMYHFLQTIMFLYSKMMNEFYFDYHLSAKENVRIFLRDRTGMTVGRMIVPPADKGIQQIYECIDRIERSEMRLRINQEDDPSSFLLNHSEESISFSSTSLKKSYKENHDEFRVRLYTVKNRRKTSRRKRSDIIL